MLRAEAGGARRRLWRLRAEWGRFWFAPGEAFDLGASRLVCCAIFTFVFLRQRRELGWSAEIDESFWLPTPLFALLDLQPLSASSLDVLVLVCAGALVAATLGVATRASCAVAALLTFYLLGLKHCFGKLNHSDTVVPIILLVLAVARSGDACSFDRLLARAFARASGGAAPIGARAGPPTWPLPSGEYTWPVRTVWLLTVLVFFAAGVSKLRHSGLAWALSDNLRDILLGQHYLPWPPEHALGLLLAEQRTLCMLLAAGVLAVETLAPLALVSSVARAVIVPALLLFVVSLDFLFGFAFAPFLGMFAFWVPWSRGARLAAMLHPPDAPPPPDRGANRHAGPSAGALLKPAASAPRESRGAMCRRRRPAPIT